MAEPLFPVLVKDATFRAPHLPAYYVVAQNGLFLVRDTPLFTATVPVTGGVPGLERQEAILALRLPRLPSALLERAVGFFRTVYERCRGEAILIIFYLPPREGQLGSFALEAPPQLVRGRFRGGRFEAELRLEYGACRKPGGAFLKLGTIHSHAHASPVHSAIDEHDELYESGLHVTVGYVDSARPAFAAAFVVGRTRFPLASSAVLGPFGAARRPPASWLDQVTIACDGWVADRRRWQRAAPEST